MHVYAWYMHMLVCLCALKGPIICCTWFIVFIYNLFGSDPSRSELQPKNIMLRASSSRRKDERWSWGLYSDSLDSLDSLCLQLWTLWATYRHQSLAGSPALKASNHSNSPELQTGHLGWLLWQWLFFFPRIFKASTVRETSDLDAIAQAMSGHDGISKARLYHTRKPQCATSKSKKSKKSNVNSECCKTVFNLGQLRQDKTLTYFDYIWHAPIK